MTTQELKKLLDDHIEKYGGQAEVKVDTIILQENIAVEDWVQERGDQFVLTLLQEQS